MTQDFQDKLLNVARQVMANAYCPYSGYSVGAALLTRQGDICSGCNVESASYGATVCAERTALCSAVAAGKRDFICVAVVSNGAVPYPCGICRQMLSELAPGADVIMQGADGVVISSTVAALFPDGFKLTKNND